MKIQMLFGIYSLVAGLFTLLYVIYLATSDDKDVEPDTMLFILILIWPIGISVLGYYTYYKHKEK